MINITDKILERFLNKIDKTNELPCWKWLGSLRDSGHGIFWLPYKNPIGAHVFSYMVFHNLDYNPSTRERKQLICHECDNGWCVNPKHLYLGNYSTNGKDMYRESCGAGHEWTEYSTYIRPDNGRRGCRICRANRYKRN